MTYPTKRDLDGIYFRVKRNGKWDSICYTDMTDEERETVVAARVRDRKPEEQAAYWKSMANIMAGKLRDVGDQLDLVARW